MLADTLAPYRYLWPRDDLARDARWSAVPWGHFRARDLPESEAELEADSRWPALFPSPLCLVTAAHDGTAALEKVVGASIVNRFPYTLALSFCRKPLSRRHHVRAGFCDVLERGGCVAVQFLPPGHVQDRALQTIASVPEHETGNRLAHAGLATRRAATNASPVLADSYLVYEATLVRPGTDFDGAPIHAQPWLDVGSHRVYFLEINAIQLRQDIARAEAQILWRALPSWQPRLRGYGFANQGGGAGRLAGYQKGYNPLYAFPSKGTVAFEHDSLANGMAIKHLPPLPADQVEVDNDRARWPCFFPSSAGMITTWADGGVPNVMPCGSTTVLSRHPLVVAPCVSYARINERYAPRATLDILRKTGRFVCGVPDLREDIVSAMRYAGNVSLARDPDKVANAGLEALPGAWGPVLSALPVHFECEVIGEVRLGTHIMFLGEARRLLVREDVTPQNPLEWCAWAALIPGQAAASQPAAAA